MKVKVQQRSVYHKFVEVEVEVPDSVEFNDIQEADSEWRYETSDGLGGRL